MAGILVSFSSQHVGLGGPVVLDLQVIPSGQEACFDADPAVLKAIVANPAGYYVNLHTDLFPSGVLRGQLSALVSAPPATADPAPSARRQRSRATRVIDSVPPALVG